MREKYRIFALLVLACILTVGWVDPAYEMNQEGIRLYEMGKYNEAAEMFTSAKGMAEKRAVVQFNSGSAYYKQRKYNLAMREYFRALRSGDDTLKTEVYYNLGNCLYKQGDLENALHYFKKAIKLDREDEDARVNYEFVLNKLSNGSQAPSGDESSGDVENVDETPTGDESREYFIDEGDRSVIYEMLEAEERSRSKKVRFDDGISGEERGKNW